MAEKLSKVKTLILHTLAEGRWVSSKVLLELTNQKYFDRRIRELRDEQGYDIEMAHREGEPHYRLRSDVRTETKTRTYLSAAEKRTFLIEKPPTCALCGSGGSVGKDLVWDHRRPLLRNGTGDIENFQLLCRNCNNQKRSICRSCTFECSLCYFAFPEKFEEPLLLRPERLDSIEKLKAEASKMGISIEDYIIAKLNKTMDF